MLNLSFERVQLMLVDPGHGFRRSLRHGLARLGFASIVDSGRLSSVTAALDEIQPDLLICDVGLPDGDACEVVRAIRHNEVSSNPFVSVISMADEPTSPTVRRVVDSGADHLLVKPVSPLQVLERIGNLVSNRKPFVVTSAYIGPDRRRHDRESTAPRIPVPNTLRAKAVGHHPQQIRKAIERTAGIVNREKIRRDAQHVLDLARQVEAAGDGASAIGRRLTLLDSIISDAADIARRAPRSEIASAAELATTLEQVANRLRRNAEAPGAVDLRLLRPLAQAIVLAVSPERGNPAIAQDISRSVTSAVAGVH